MFLQGVIIVLLNIPFHTHTMLAYYNRDHPLSIIIINKILLVKTVPIFIHVIIASLVLTGQIHQVQRQVVEYHKLAVVIILSRLLIRVWMI